MASSIRVRAISNGDITEVQALIQHPMDSGFVKDPQGRIIPAHFIQQLTFEHNGKNVFVADWECAYVFSFPFARRRWRFRYSCWSRAPRPRVRRTPQPTPGRFATIS